MKRREPGPIAEATLVARDWGVPGHRGWPAEANTRQDPPSIQPHSHENNTVRSPLQLRADASPGESQNHRVESTSVVGWPCSTSSVGCANCSGSPAPTGRLAVPTYRRARGARAGCDPDRSSLCGRAQHGAARSRSACCGGRSPWGRGHHARGHTAGSVAFGRAPERTARHCHLPLRDADSGLPAAARRSRAATPTRG